MPSLPVSLVAAFAERLDAVSEVVPGAGSRRSIRAGSLSPETERGGEGSDGKHRALSRYEGGGGLSGPEPEHAEPDAGDAQLARSTRYHPMLLSAATAGAGALPAPKAEGGMVSGLLEFIDLDSVIVAESGNPIADLAALGHGLLNAALAAIAALMGAATGSGLLESIPFIGKGLDVFESAWQVSDALVSTLLGLLIIAGAVLAYVLPAIPFIRFLFGILGWILNVAVAVLAVTVFAAAHVTREDGNRLITQATRQGWLFLPALVLRPALMLLGLILGYFVFLAAIGLFGSAMV